MVGHAEAEVWQVAKKVKVKGRRDPGSHAPSIGDAVAAGGRSVANVHRPWLRDVCSPAATAPAKAETKTARYPAGGNNEVQRPCLYGSATMDCGLDPSSKRPHVSKATCGQSADQGWRPGPGHQRGQLAFAEHGPCTR